MVSFNFLKKKKDDGFSLDDYSLPSLNEDQNKEVPSIPSDNSPLPDSSLTPLPQEDTSQSLSNGNTFSPGFNSMNSPTESLPLNPSGSPAADSFSNPFAAPAQNEQQSNSQSFGNEELLETKLSHIETKLSLMEARAQSAESKLDLIYEMLLSEVSEETKRKLKVKSMMSSIKDS